MYVPDRFIFETPFTKKGGQVHGDMSEQYKRKTILTVEATFPYLKRRLKIIEKQEVLDFVGTACFKNLM
jgi:hypothetical protein